MKKLNHWLRNYFGFSKTESNGFIILIPLIGLIMAAPYLWRYYSTQKTAAVDTEVLDSLVAKLERNIEIIEKKERRRFTKRFKAHSYEKEERFEKKTFNENKSQPENSYSGKKIIKKKVALQPFDINEADTSTLKKIYGIGPVLSERVVKYRDMLGGFVNKRQLKEVYGLKGDALQKLDSLSFINKTFEPEKISVNDTKFYILDDHPYVSKTMARAIDSYRFQHGNLEGLNDLYEIKVIDSTDVKKAYPYLRF